MNKNIFENAKFGDRFRTREGRMALFIGKDATEQKAIILYNLSLTEYPFIRSENVSIYNGKVYETIEHGNDIVSRWQEKINEEELNRLAEEYETSSPHFINADKGITIGYRIQEAFKTGYRKAKQE